MSNRRGFIKGAGVGIAALVAALPETAIGSVNPALHLTLPVQNRVLSHQTREVSGGKEHVVLTEIVGANGVKHVTDTLLRDLGTHKIVTMRTKLFASQGDLDPVETRNKTVFVEVLDVEGIDKKSVTVTVADENGIREPRTMFVARDLPNPAEGASDDQEIMDKIFTHKKLKGVRFAD